MPTAKAKALIQTIKKIPIFNGLSPSEIQKVLNICVSKNFQPGEVLCVRNAESDHMFILISGELGIMSEESAQLAALRPITTVGEMGIITRHKRTAQVDAIAPSKLLVIERAPFDFMLDADADMKIKVYRNIVRILSGKIVNDNSRVNDHLQEKVRSEKLIGELRQKLDIALDMLAEQTPISRQEAATQIDEKMIDIPPLRILIVDDEPAICNFVKQALRAYQVDEASNGEEALIAVRANRPDLVITDIRMPGMDGFALSEALKEEFPDLPVVALSGYVGAEDIQGYNFAAFIDKPMSLDGFVDIVENTLVKN